MADYNKLLYEKVRVEYESFIEALKKMTPEQVIEKAYEKVIKEDMVTEIQQRNLEPDEAKALCSEDHPLDLMYQEWLDTDVSYMGLLRDSIDDTAKKAVAEYKKEHRTVTKPGAVVEYEGVQYSVGTWFVADKRSDYAGLTGIILELFEEDGALDITCNMSIPTDSEEITAIEKRFTKLYQEPMTLQDISFEGIILASDEIHVIPDKPSCYNPESDNPYPLCVGNGSDACKSCCLYVDLDYNSYE